LADFIRVSAVENLKGMFDLVSLQCLIELTIGTLNTFFLCPGVESNTAKPRPASADLRENRVLTPDSKLF